MSNSNFEDDNQFTDEELRAMLEINISRLADKQTVPDDVVSEEEAHVKPPKDPNVEWRSFPSVPDQLHRFPNTVRTGPKIDAVFNLSEPTELREFNKIQADASNQIDGLSSIIHAMDKQFHQGQWYALVTYSKLFYQKL